MTDLQLLRVSLTKHGAHKLARLLEAFPADQVLNQVSGTYEGVRIDRAQTAANLSVRDGDVPALWEEARGLGREEINKLVFVAIVFSHHRLIEAMMAATTGLMSGSVLRGRDLAGKAFTNFACVLNELGLATEHNAQFVSYDLSSLFDSNQLPKLVRGLLSLKLAAAGWDGEGDVVEECIRLGLHDVFAITSDSFRSWLSPQYQAMESDEPEEETGIDVVVRSEYRFSPGHTPRQVGSVDLPARVSGKAMLLHNEIQQSLYEQLCDLHGADAVGTENTRGSGVIDLVVRQNDTFVFYEIKTASTVRGCIREAMGQLLEYAYWPDVNLAARLVIVGEATPDESEGLYLAHLRQLFGLPIYYRQFTRRTGALGGEL